nr:hypothetical protein RchiOBHm_Chr4g0437271 [Ipomoea batatas]GMD16872.1 hypothetical protein RchiOBHm_Chr4g0437271 [Ipomoea batatas]GMD18334.1 hypothetical protein RchiOBHm_Chr4g0437271 [Ipomoea batatas]GMD21114.1 hypothetical protein RchiOBHm_Chr4g0437271 [Ipomoea batatas]
MESEGKMGKGNDKKVLARRRYSSVCRSLFAPCFYSEESSEKPCKAAKPLSDPEAAMVASFKHFSSAHKVHLDH